MLAEHDLDGRMSRLPLGRMQGIQAEQGPSAPIELNRSLRDSAFIYLPLMAAPMLW